MARRFSLLALALVTGVTAVSLGGFWLMRRGLAEQNQRLLQADTSQVGQLLTADFSGLSTSLASLGTVAQLTNADPVAFDQHAKPLAVHGTSLALLRLSGTQPTVVGGVGGAFSPGRAIDPRLAADLAGANGKLDTDVLSHSRGFDTLAFFVGAPVAPPGTAVALEVSFPTRVSTASLKNGPFKDLDFALYASSAVSPGELVFTTTSDVLQGPHVARVSSTVGADTWLVLARAKTPLVGSLAANAPWIVLGVGLLLAVMAGTIVENLSRRERFAAAMVDRRTAELERQSALVALMGEVGDTLQSCLSVDEVGTVVSHHAEALLPGTSGALYVIAASRNELDVAANWGVPVASPFFAPDDCWALRRGRVHMAGGAASGLRCAHAENEESESVCIPMLAQGETVGLLHVRNTGTGPEGSNHDCDLSGRLPTATTLGEHLGLAIANLQLRDRLRNQSIRDPLTGLFNRRYMEESLDRELHRAARHQVPVGVLMIDLDHFKEFNDSFGHESGDLALCKVAEAFVSNLRGEDIACRYGGEEFVLVLPGASSDDARMRAEAIAQRVRALPVLAAADGGATRPLSVSVGVASYPADGSAAKDVIRAADVALYSAKTSGRDRVVTSDQATA